MTSASRKRFLGLWFLVVVAAGAQSQTIPGIQVTGPAVGTHDPTIVRVGDRFLRVSTGRGIPLATSTDLVDWQDAGRIFAENPKWSGETIPGSGDFWAPDLVQRKGVWRLYYSVSTFGSNRSAIGLATNSQLDATAPDRGWHDQGPIWQSRPEDDYNAIDPQVVQGERDWLVFGSFWSGIKIVPLTEEGTVPNALPTALAQRPAPDAIEGAFLMPHGNRYYLFVSFDACCRGKRSTYNIRVGRSDSLLGPYVDREGRPLLDGGGSLVLGSSDRDIGPGHNSVLSDRGIDYLVYHVYDARYGGASRLRIQPMVWNDGWPEVASTVTTAPLR